MHIYWMTIAACLTPHLARCLKIEQPIGFVTESD
jgi:hypothetical protein